jgi:hypothetical protein
MTLFTQRMMAIAAVSLTTGLFAVAELGFQGQVDAAAESPTNSVTLKPVSDFDSIVDKNKRAVAVFEEAGKVIQSPRCLNCHPATERPTQTDKMKPHQPLVVRGEGGMGAPGGLVCTTCHHEANFDPAGVPGNPTWHLAPAEMAWKGKSLGQICVQIKDPGRNGGKDLAQMVQHVAEDPLVGWGWNPGGGRMPAPGTQKQFGELIEAWVEAGATCPS